MSIFHHHDQLQKLTCPNWGPGYAHVMLFAIARSEEGQRNRWQYQNTKNVTREWHSSDLPFNRFAASQMNWWCDHFRSTDPYHLNIKVMLLFEGAYLQGASRNERVRGRK